MKIQSNMSLADKACFVPVVGNGIVGTCTIVSNIVKSVRGLGKLAFFAISQRSLTSKLALAEKKVEYYVDRYKGILPVVTNLQKEAEATRDGLQTKKAAVNAKIRAIKDDFLQHLEFIVIGFKRVAYGPVRSYRLMKENAALNEVQARLTAKFETSATLNEIVRFAKARTAGFAELNERNAAIEDGKATVAVTLGGIFKKVAENVDKAVKAAAEAQANTSAAQKLEKGAKLVKAVETAKNRFMAPVVKSRATPLAVKVARNVYTTCRAAASAVVSQFKDSFEFPIAG